MSDLPDFLKDAEVIDLGRDEVPRNLSDKLPPYQYFDELEEVSPGKYRPTGRVFRLPRQSKNEG